MLWALGAERKASAQRDAALRGVARLVGAAVPAHGDSSVSGHLREQRVTFRFTSRSSGKSRRPWTEIDVVVPRGPLRFALLEQTPAQEALRDRGLLIDITTGDEIFDDAFIVEAAPADVTRALLDDELRAALLAARPFAVVPGDGLLRLEIPGLVTQPPRVHALVELAARLGAGIRPAHAAADAALEAAAPRDGSPYRASPAAEPIRAAKRARLDEIATLAATQARRATHDKLVAAGFLALMGFIYLGIWWASSR